MVCWRLLEYHGRLLAVRRTLVEVGWKLLALHWSLLELACFRHVYATDSRACTEKLHPLRAQSHSAAQAQHP